MTELKAYQALASQIEQVIDLLLQDHTDRLKWRTEVLRRLDSRPASGHDDTFLTTRQAKTLWTVAKTASPWVLTVAVSLFHLLSHLLHH